MRLSKWPLVQPSSLGHGQSTGAHSETDSLDAKVLVVAAAAVNVLVRSIVEVRRVEGLVAVCAGEAALVPDPVLADHLFGGVDGVSASGAAGPSLALEAVQWSAIGEGDRRLSIGRHEGGGVAVAEALGSEQLSVARAAVDLAVRPVAGQRRVQRPVALGAVEALLVPHRALGQLLFRGEHGTAAARAALSLGRQDRGRVGVVEWSFRGDLVLTGGGEMKN